MNNIKVKIDKKQIKKNKKQTKPRHKLNKKRIIVLILVIIITVAIYFAYKRWQKFQTLTSINSNTGTYSEEKQCSDIFNPKCWSEAFKPRLEQENGVTGVLIVGLDTRDKGAVEQGVNNTDSIIVALYNHQTKKTSLISFPRDLYVPYYINDKGPYHARINAIYSTGEQRSDVEDGFDLLQNTVERILNQKIQYRVIVKLKGVEDLVDAIGGIDIQIPTYLKVKYPNDYPGKDGKNWNTWLYYEFEPGTQHLDGEHALVWSRFRKVVKGDMTYASDFSRAERQQQVLNAIKEKALNDEGSITSKAKKYFNILKTAGNNIDISNFGLEEILAGFYIAQEADTNPTNIILDPNFGGLNTLIYHPPTEQTGGAYYIKIKDETFKAIQDFLNVIWQNPKIYDENAHILIENHTGKKLTKDSLAIKFKNLLYSHKFPLTASNLTMLTKNKSDENGVIIVDFTKGEKHHTTKYLVEFFQAKLLIEDPQNYDYKQTNYKEDIKIILNPPEPEQTSSQLNLTKIKGG